MVDQHKEIIQQHQNFSEHMHAKASESNIRLQSTLQAVHSFFSNALVNAGHDPLLAIEPSNTQTVQMLEAPDASAKRRFHKNSDGNLILVGEKGKPTQTVSDAVSRFVQEKDNGTKIIPKDDHV